MRCQVSINNIADSLDFVKNLKMDYKLIAEKMESTSRDQIPADAVCVYFVLMPLGKAVIHLPHSKQTGVSSLEGEQF